VLLNSLSLTGEAVEVGVLKGEFSERLLSRWQGKLLHAVDAWRSLPGYTDIANVSNEEHEANRVEAMKRLARFGSRCQIHRILSEEAASLFENGSLDFVYLDADHSFESVWQDLSVWYPKVRIGGILAGHDFLDGELPEGNFGVESAVRMFQQIHQFELSTTDDPPWRSWYFTKSK
jgi:cephalosporin hydroxylase